MKHFSPLSYGDYHRILLGQEKCRFSDILQADLLEIFIYLFYVKQWQIAINSLATSEPWICNCRVNIWLLSSPLSFSFKRKISMASGRVLICVYSSWGFLACGMHLCKHRETHKLRWRWSAHGKGKEEAEHLSAGWLSRHRCAAARWSRVIRRPGLNELFLRLFTLTLI